MNSTNPANFNGAQFWPPVLLCPSCGSTDGYTHAHGQVELYDSRPPEGRISFRIAMWCEQCPVEFDLLIEQHKGQTYTLTQPRPDRRSDATAHVAGDGLGQSPPPGPMPPGPDGGYNWAEAYRRDMQWRDEQHWPR